MPNRTLGNPCPTCDGSTGPVQNNADTVESGFTMIIVNCPDCDGTGTAS